MSTDSKGKLNKFGIGTVAGSIIGPVIIAVILFVSAGRIDLPRAWIFSISTFVYYLVWVLIMLKLDPGLLNHRGAWKRKKGTKVWDKALLTLYGVFAFYIQSIIMGLDVGRYEWSSLGVGYAVLGFVLYTVGFLLFVWATTENTFFETTVRIQKDRGHEVVSAGPYALVRHPGYTGTVLWAVGAPLIVGSLYGLIPGAVAVLVMITRTALEDKTLRRELAGYLEYSKRVRYRLFPGVW